MTELPPRAEFLRRLPADAASAHVATALSVIPEQRWSPPTDRERLEEREQQLRDLREAVGPAVQANRRARRRADALERRR